jgi:hypothetical protein
VASCIPLVGKDKACLTVAEKGERQQYADQAMEVLRQAVSHGYKDLVHLRSDPELDPLRSHADFEKLVAELETKTKTESK